MSRHKEDVLARFEEYTSPEPNTGCLLWFGAMRPDRNSEVPVFFNGSKQTTPGRWAYQQKHEIQLKRTEWIESTCGYKWCCNVDHLRRYRSVRDKDYWHRWSKKQRARLNKRMAELKSDPCMDCGGKFPPECMDFDHVRGEKKGSVSDLIGNTDGSLEEEIAKCELVCANCHRIRTRRRHNVP